MRILYLTPAWFGFDKMLYDGEQEITGLPSFTYPLKELIDRGHKVDMIIIHSMENDPSLNIKSEWVSKINIIGFQKYELSTVRKLFSIRNYRNSLKRLLQKNSYDFVYAHGSSPAVVRSIVIKNRVPFAQRLYGTFLWDKIKTKGLLFTALKHAVEFLSFKSEKSFLLATNDGSGADNVVARLFKNQPPPYEFYYWKNGVSRLDISPERNNKFQTQISTLGPYVFYCARFDDWKRQDRIINILKLAKEKDVILNAVFAGPFDTLGDAYYKSVLKLANEAGVIEQCRFLGSISKEKIYLYNKHAIASLSLNDVCNVTSVFHEMMASGALMIIKNDIDVREYIKNEENGFLVNSDEEAVSIILKVMESPQKYNILRSKICELSFSLTKDWAVRAREEVALIEAFSDKKHT